MNVKIVNNLILAISLLLSVQLLAQNKSQTIDINMNKINFLLRNIVFCPITNCYIDEENLMLICNDSCDKKITLNIVLDEQKKELKLHGAFFIIDQEDSLQGYFNNDSINSLIQLYSNNILIGIKEFQNSTKPIGINLFLYGYETPQFDSTILYKGYIDFSFKKDFLQLKINELADKQLTYLVSNLNEQHKYYEVYFYENGHMMKENYIEKVYYIDYLNSRNYSLNDFVVYKERSLENEVILNNFLTKKSLIIYRYIHLNFIPHPNNKEFHIKSGVENIYDDSGNLLLRIKYKANGNVKNISFYDKYLKKEIKTLFKKG